MQIREFSGEEYEHLAREIYVPMIARMDPDFCGRAAIQELGEAVTLFRSHWKGSMSAVRTARMAARASADDVMIFCINLSGQSEMLQNDRLAKWAAGTGILIEARSPYERISRTETRWLTLQFSRRLLPLHTAEITEACARSVDPAAPAMQMLSAYLVQLFKEADDLTAHQQLDAGHAAIDVLAMALRGVTPSVPRGDGSEEVLLEMMRTHVREHLADPDLRVEELARRHYVSVRQAYTLFERIGTTPGAYLREQRLLAAQAMLSDSRYDRLAIASIAVAVGVLDLRTFERAFRRQFGMTPGSCRHEHRHSGPAPATVQSECRNAAQESPDPLTSW
ncbi:helix-turn-helix domain-containing protein [Pseudonocardia yunnanensis]|uniref:Helix-turn-helix domain-containing protein n=1 Tax=Pseudonocardia yunnanensis TaxID=58107 RepID=A0ABW4ET91_9PSEU